MLYYLGVVLLPTLANASVCARTPARCPLRVSAIEDLECADESRVCVGSVGKYEWVAFVGRGGSFCLLQKVSKSRWGVVAVDCRCERSVYCKRLRMWVGCVLQQKTRLGGRQSGLECVTRGAARVRRLNASVLDASKNQTHLRLRCIQDFKEHLHRWKTGRERW